MENKNDMKIGSRYQQSYSPTGLHKGKFKRKCVLNKKDDGKKSLSIINNNNNQTEAVCDSREIKCTAESTKPLSQCSCAYVGPPTHGSRYLRMERERKKLEDASAEFISIEIYRKKFETIQKSQNKINGQQRYRSS